MEVKQPSTPSNAWKIFDSPRKIRHITWAPKRPRSKSMFTRLPGRIITKPRRLCFSEAFEDDGTDETLATPIENAVNELAALNLKEADVASSPVSNRDRAYTELTPSEIDQKIQRFQKKLRKGDSPEKNSDGDRRYMRASRRIKLDDIIEQKLKSMCKNVR